MLRLRGEGAGVGRHSLCLGRGSEAEISGVMWPSTVNGPLRDPHTQDYSGRLVLFQYNQQVAQEDRTDMPCKVRVCEMAATPPAFSLSGPHSLREGLELDSLPEAL